MVHKENLQKLLRQQIMKPFLENETVRKISFLQDKTSQDIYDNFLHFNKIISENNIFVGNDSEMNDLRELQLLLQVM